MDIAFIWALFFSCRVQMAYHPGNKAGVVFRDCAEDADLMLAEFLRRFPKE